MRFPLDDLPEFENEAVAELAGEVRRLTAEHTRKQELAAEADRALDRAKLADVEARATGIRTGKQVKPTAGDKALAALEAAQRDEAAFEGATRQAEADLLAALEEHHGDMRREVQEDVGVARASIGRLLDELGAERARLAHGLALGGWLEGVKAGGVEDRRGDWHRAPAFRPERFAARVALVGPSGDPISVAEAVAALRALAEPADPKPALPQAQPLRPTA